MNDEPVAGKNFRTSTPLSRRSHGVGGFTLLELLTVMGIIAILAGIVLGVGRRASESGKIARAKVELAALSNALEAYRIQYGDYPQIGAVANVPTAPSATSDDGPGILFNALAGKRGPKSALTAIDARVQVEFAKFLLQVPTLLPTAGNTSQIDNAFLDPWGNRYLYFYKTSSAWTNSSFVLYSVGPDGLHTNPPGIGLIDVVQPGNADNLYANSN